MLILVRLIELRVNDGQSQIQKEEGSYEHKQDKEKYHQESQRESLLVHDHVSTPPFHSDTDEHNEQAVEHVVKAQVVIAGIYIAFTTLVDYRSSIKESVVSDWTALGSSAQELIFSVKGVLPSRVDIEAAVFEVTHEQLDTSNGEDQEEEKEHNEGVSE